MDAESLKAVGLVAGIGGVALAVLMTVFREVIRKSIFPTLDHDAGYRLLRLILVLTWTIALAGVGAWLMAKQWEQPRPAVEAKQQFSIVGLITDQQENGIPDASVSVVGAGSFVKSDSTGAFTLTAWVGAERDLIVRITKEGFRPKTQRVTLPTTNLIVQMDTALRVPPGQTTPDAAAGFEDGGARDPVGPVPAMLLPAEPPANRGTISIQYLGDAVGCGLNLSITVGERNVVPTANPFVVYNVLLGPTQYNVVGTISCPTGAGVVSCVAAGNGQLLLRSGAAYNIVWQNTGVGQCGVGLTPAG